MCLNLTVCSGYVGVTCVNGTCPVALRDEYIEYGIPVPESCGMCSAYKGCIDCYLDGTDYCSFGKHKKRYLIPEGYVLMSEWYLKKILSLFSEGKTYSNNRLKYSGLPTYRYRAMYKVYKTIKRNQSKIRWEWNHGEDFLKLWKI